MEHGDLDIMILTPGLTATNMPKGLNFLNTADSPASCAGSALRDLG